ncbi:MAG: M90 family metallopeptidase [Burkholderiaceae bacterium]
MALLILFAVAIVGMVWFLSKPARRRRRHERHGDKPFPDQWRKILRRRMPYYRRLPFNLQRQLQQQIHVFIAEKNFVGCRGLEVTDEMRVLIAAQACLLLLNRQTGCYPTMSEVLVYPDTFIVERDEVDAANVVHRVRRPVSGESWANSQVVLSWADVLEGAADPGDGQNVVIHEFAHQLDQESGSGNGAPGFSDAEQAGRWSDVLSNEFNRLREQLAIDSEPLLDPYGAQSPVEFFAVATETFFERPVRLYAEHPLLYEELARYYCVSPLLWDD